MKGISPLIAFVLTLALTVFSIGIVIQVILPTLNRVKDSNVINEALQNLALLDKYIREVASEAQGSKRSFSFSASEGKYAVDLEREQVYFEYETRSDFYVEGLINNVYADKSPVYLEFFNQHSDGTVPSDWTCTNCSIEANSLAVAGTAWHNLGKLSNFLIEIKNGSSSGRPEVFIIPADPNNLVLFLPFDEGSGSIAYDYSKYANNGTLLDANTTNADGDTPPSWTDGKFGKALSFDGIDDYVNVSNENGEVFNANSSFTITAWFNPYSDPITEDHHFSIVGEWQITLAYKVYNSTHNYLTLEGSWSNVGWNGARWIFEEPLVTHRWYFIVGIYDGNNLYLYVNSELKAKLENVGYNSRVPQDIHIGIWGYPGLGPFYGLIDEVRIYNRALSEAEIKAEYEAGLKKLTGTGKTTYISFHPNATLVLANPTGVTHFNQVKIKTNEKRIHLTLPFSNIDFNTSFRIGSGNYKLTIEHMGINTTSNKPIIKVYASG